jgi:hypothetical protein
MRFCRQDRTEALDERYRFWGGASLRSPDNVLALTHTAQRQAAIHLAQASTPRPPVHRMEVSCSSELLEGSPIRSHQQALTTSSPVFPGVLDITAKTHSKYGRCPWSGMNLSSIWPHGHYTRRRPIIF